MASEDIEYRLSGGASNVSGNTASSSGTETDGALDQGQKRFTKIGSSGKACAPNFDDTISSEDSA